MLAQAAALPEQCRQGWEQGLAWAVPSLYKNARQLLVLGMGGSAIGGDFLQGVVREAAARPIAVSRTYTIPAWVDRETLVLTCSYSGNTEETLSAAGLAMRAGAKLVAITAGGELSAFAARKRFPLLRIPSGLPPRTALGYLAFAPLGLLTQLGWVPKKSVPVEQACASLTQFIAKRLAPSVPLASNPAKQLAGALKGRLPVIYGSGGEWEAIAYRWRTQFEENSKTLAFHHLFPEATHNEISGWLEPAALVKKMAAVFLVDKSMHPRVRRRMKFTEQIVRAQKAAVQVVQVPGESVLSRMLAMISLGDFTSIYLAFLYGIDPTPVARVEALKRYMKKPSLRGTK